MSEPTEERIPVSLARVEIKPFDLPHNNAEELLNVLGKFGLHQGEDFSLTYAEPTYGQIQPPVFPYAELAYVRGGDRRTEQRELLTAKSYARFIRDGAESVLAPGSLNAYWTTVCKIAVVSSVTVYGMKSPHSKYYERSNEYRGLVNRALEPESTPQVVAALEAVERGSIQYGIRSSTLKIAPAAIRNVKPFLLWISDHINAAPQSS